MIIEFNYYNWLQLKLFLITISMYRNKMCFLFHYFASYVFTCFLFYFLSRKVSLDTISLNKLLIKSLSFISKVFKVIKLLNQQNIFQTIIDFLVRINCIFTEFVIFYGFFLLNTIFRIMHLIFSFNCFQHV